MSERRPKRPRDPAQLAKLIVDIATGEVEDRERTPEEQGKDPAAVALGRKGGKARASKMNVLQNDPLPIRDIGRSVARLPCKKRASLGENSKRPYSARSNF